MTVRTAFFLDVSRNHAITNNMPQKLANSGAQFRTFTCMRCSKGKSGNLREVNAWITLHARFCKDMNEDDRERTIAAASVGMPNVTDRKAFKKATQSTVTVGNGMYGDPMRAPLEPARAVSAVASEQAPSLKGRKVSQHVLEGRGMTDEEFERMLVEALGTKN